MQMKRRSTSRWPDAGGGRGRADPVAVLPAVAWDMWRQRFKDLGLAHLALEADIAVNGWVARGLGRSMLESICMQLFGVRPGEMCESDSRGDLPWPAARGWPPES